LKDLKNDEKERVVPSDGRSAIWVDIVWIIEGIINKLV